jgi:hypothetical protein
MTNGRRWFSERVRDGQSEIECSPHFVEVQHGAIALSVPPTDERHGEAPPAGDLFHLTVPLAEVDRVRRRRTLVVGGPPSGTIANVRFEPSPR